jgi:ACT domain-containing protein
VYHTPRDTVDQIEPVWVEAVLDVAVNYMTQRDERSSASDTMKGERQCD